MTVTYDSIGGGQAGTNSATSMSLSWSHTIATSGANTCVVVPVGWWAQTSVSSLTATYNGVSMTAVDTSTVSMSGQIVVVKWFSLFNPPTGAQTVAVAGTDTGSGSRWYAGISLAYQGAATVITGGANNSNSPTPTLVVSSAGGEIAASAMVSNNVQSSGSVSQTLRYNDTVQTDMLVQDAAGAASVSFTSTATSGPWTGLGLRLQPVAAANTGAFFGMFL